MPTHKKHFHQKKHPTVKSLAKKVERVSLRDRPVYLVYDDATQDYLSGSPASVGYIPYYKYVGYSITSLSTAPSLMNAGTSEGDVRGNTINIISLTIRGEAFIPASGDLTNLVRIIVYWDRNFGTNTSSGSISNNVPTTNSHLLARYDGSTANGITGNVFSGYNVGLVGKTNRFNILWDHAMTLSLNGPTLKKIFKKIKIHRKMSCQTNQGGSVSWTQGIGVCLISDSAVTPNPNVSLQFRLCYTSG